jgi:hypothetical protein
MGSSTVIRIGRLIAHGFRVAKVFTDIHGQTTSTSAKTVSFWSEFAAMAVLAEHLTVVLGAVGGVEEFIAEPALETGLVPLLSSGQSFLSSVDGFAALGALGVLWRLERHFGCLVSVVDPIN